MFKKVFGILIFLIFLLCISTTVAEENIDGNYSQITDLGYINESNLEDSKGVDDNNCIVEEYVGNFDENRVNIQTCDLEPLEINTTGVIMSDDDYSCGAASFATVLSNLGINLTLNDARIAVNTSINGTSMAGIIEGAVKYNLTAYGISTDINNLNENFIVHMSINGNDHWSVIKYVSDDYVILADPNLGNVNYTKEEFAKFYTNNSIFISKSFIRVEKIELTSFRILNIDETKKITGKKVDCHYRYKKAYKQFRVIRHNKKNRLQYRWVYPVEIWHSYSYYKPYRWYYWDTYYKYSKWYNASK